MFLFPIIACHKIKKINKRNFGKERREIALLLMLLVTIRGLAKGSLLLHPTGLQA
jgi:hypothetical protein